jgi:hypothetical protein
VNTQRSLTLLAERHFKLVNGRGRRLWAFFLHKREMMTTPSTNHMWLMSRQSLQHTQTKTCLSNAKATTTSWKQNLRIHRVCAMIAVLIFSAQSQDLLQCVNAFSFSSPTIVTFRMTPPAVNLQLSRRPLTTSSYAATQPRLLSSFPSLALYDRQNLMRLYELLPNGEIGNDGFSSSTNGDTTPTDKSIDNTNDASLALSSSFSSSTNSKIDYYSNLKPQVVPQRWVQLAYLSLLALLSDWVCFSVAAAPGTFETNFDHSAASIIDIFLFTNVATSFLVTDVVAKFGLQRAIQGAAVFMMVGCWLRAGVGFILPAFLSWGIVGGSAGTTTTTVLVDYPWIVAGTVLVGIAQPFFQCTPPLLSAKWFANNERSTSTAIALNFNQIGIAIAFLVGGAMASSTTGLENYFGLIACMTTLVTIGTLLQFQNEPPLPPSTSELEKLIKGEKEPPFLESVQTFFSTKGFTRPLAAFICSISITNVVGVRSFFAQRDAFFFIRHDLSRVQWSLTRACFSFAPLFPHSQGIH